ncbi:MAG: MbnH family di-heme enzyme [Ferruginibacter sp.]
MNKKRNGIFVMFIIVSVVLSLSHLLPSCKSNNTVEAYRSADSAKIELGRFLFFDRRLSVNNTRSCATCHNPQFAFTDGYKRSLGAYADLHQRNTQPLFNLGYLKYFTAADSTLHSPLQQMDNPLFNTHPAEMGVKGNEEKILQRITADKEYQQMFASLNSKISWANIKGAISLFVNSLQSANSPYDQFIKGDSAALTEAQKKGKQLFFSAALKCASCHGGFNFSTPSVSNEKGDTLFYFNTGLYDIDAQGAYPTYDQGLYRLTKNRSDMGKFRVPSLRNLVFTAPYFHDGTAATLAEVIDAYALGGRIIGTGIYKGDGAKNPFKHPLISGFAISESEKINLISFLQSLSDTGFVNNPEYQNPFTADETKKK